MQKEIIITGYGVVAKELCKLLLDKSESIMDAFGIELKVNGIIGSKGMLYQREGLNLASLVMEEVGSKALSNYAQNHQISFLEPRFQGDVLVECTPTNIKDGEPALAYMLEAMDGGMDVVAISKGALVHSYQTIKDKAESTRSKLKFSGATAAALPTIDIGEYNLAGCTITRIEGILNGTSNFILTSMYEDNLSFSEALKIAQRKGIAEANPSLDIKGFDSGCKILLLANELLGTNYTIDDVSINGIEHLTRDDIVKTKMKQSRVKLLARAYKDEEKVVLDVQPCELDQAHPLYHVNGTNKGILFETEEMGTICTTGGASHPRGAAAAALKDLINLYRKS
ncbi:homoserine dehydrogenase [Psychrobacillus sp. NPDC096389]|uniref:homoserine dehydrogenase n=1 Tax=Psychrobacillus sp. NPDC096389 TaxID=3364490 RepID=UPI0037F41BCD